MFFLKFISHFSISSRVVDCRDEGSVSEEGQKLIKTQTQKTDANLRQHRFFTLNISALLSSFFTAAKSKANADGNVLTFNGVVRSNHRIACWQTPTLTVLIGSHIVGGL